VGVIRDRKEQNLNLSLPDHKDHSGLYEEESLLGEPTAEAESYLDLGKLQDEIAKAQTQVDLRRELEKAQESYQKAQNLYQDQAAEQAGRAQKKFQQEQKKMERQLDRMLDQMRADWL
jgi:hypothetical protein